MRQVRVGAAVLVAGIGLAAGAAQAGPTYSFVKFRTNSEPDVSSQMTVELNADVSLLGISPRGANQVDFTFRNSGPLASSIADIYFDDGSLLGIAQIFSGGPGVSFSQNASPGNLPGGNTINFVTSAGFSMDSNPPVQPNGINPGELLTVRFNLINGQTLADTIAALELGLANPGVDVAGGLRIGIHVQGLAGGGSDSYVNGTPDGPEVPLPSVAVMGLVGLAAVARRRRLA